jgi:hypothetical protein
MALADLAEKVMEVATPTGSVAGVTTAPCKAMQGQRKWSGQSSHGLTISCAKGGCGFIKSGRGHVISRVLLALLLPPTSLILQINLQVPEVIIWITHFQN